MIFVHLWVTTKVSGDDLDHYAMGLFQIDQLRELIALMVEWGFETETNVPLDITGHGLELSGDNLSLNIYARALEE